MKYLSEFRDPALVERLVDELHKVTTGSWTLMEVCGGQTHSLVKNGLMDLLPAGVRMVHGPGCPVCVTPVPLIDLAVRLVRDHGATVFSFGDMLRVPGTTHSLSQAKAEGGDVRVVYSPLEAVQFAQANPQKQVVFFAVGFETTAPANALALVHAHRLGLRNFSLLASQVLVPPAMTAVLQDPNTHIQGFLAAGHVCTIMGLEEYAPIVERFRVPIIVTGFEPVDLLHGILLAVQQLERGEAKLENQYARVVRAEGNPDARRVLRDVFRVADREWRGIGTIPQSGLEVREEYADFDAKVRFGLEDAPEPVATGCIAGLVLTGQARPTECQHFGSRCTPLTPVGAPMVSSEGACAAYYHVARAPVQLVRGGRHG
ncbi:MAG: hydrogenase formation protein HypD [Gemmatimonadaceae bacterium]|nr:hydrogenase formation protein HypD [Gemmatimonadaceae bacterium]